MSNLSPSHLLSNHEHNPHPTRTTSHLSTTQDHDHNTSQPHRITSRHSTNFTTSRSHYSEDPERPRSPTQPALPAPEDIAPPPTAETTFSRRGAHYAGLCLAAMIGTLIRLGLEALASYDGQVIYNLAWAQGVGCGIMGLALARKNEIIAIYPPIYTFLTTGVAGSVTTFSSWMLESYLAFSNFDRYSRGGLYDTMDGLGYTFSTFAISIGCLYWGEHISTVLPSLQGLVPVHPKSNLVVREKLAAGNLEDHAEDEEAQQNGVSGGGSSETSNGTASAQDPNSTHTHSGKTPNGKPQIIGHTPKTDLLWISTAAIAYLIALLLYFLAPKYFRHRAVFPILMSPPGALLRFALANLNPLPIFFEKFPLGTFIANQLATLIISGCFAAQRLSTTGVYSSAIRCNALYAIQQGFCGCLSTVSTFVVESRAIQGWKWKWLYIGGSVFWGHIFVLAIVGGVGWSTGYGDVCTGY